MPEIRKWKILATALVAGIVFAMILQGEYLLAVFPLWFLSNLLADMERTGKLFPYELSLNPEKIIKNQWFMIVVVLVLWLGGVLD